LYWKAVGWLALEHLHVRDDANGVHADGLIVGTFDGAPLRVHYQLECDRGWRTSAIRVNDLNTDERIELQHPASEGWRESNGAERADLADAIDVDIAATPFTNTLPIRRLRLDPGRAQEVTVVYIAVTPSLSFRPVRQRYTRLASAADSDRYLYESLESEFKRELVVDPNGFVIDYPDVWHHALA